MESEVVLIAGLPGSGKTTYLSQMSVGCWLDWLIFDDFKAQAFQDCAKFRSSTKFPELIRALREGRNCVVADINLCKAESREEAERDIAAEVPGVKLNWRCFQNEPSSCAVNVRRRPSRTDLQRQRELQYLAEYSPIYEIPAGAVILPVWRGEEHWQQAAGN
jgi:hypothetical protein